MLSAISATDAGLRVFLIFVGTKIDSIGKVSGVGMNWLRFDRARRNACWSWREFRGK
jgi:hypothetical protein